MSVSKALLSAILFVTMCASALTTKYFDGKSSLEASDRYEKVSARYEARLALSLENINWVNVLKSDKSVMRKRFSGTRIGMPFCPW